MEKIINFKDTAADAIPGQRSEKYLCQIPCEISLVPEDENTNGIRQWKIMGHPVTATAEKPFRLGSVHGTKEDAERELQNCLARMQAKTKGIIEYVKQDARIIKELPTEILLYNIEWYIPSDVKDAPNLPSEATVEMPIIPAGRKWDSDHTEVLHRNLVSKFGFAPKCFTYRVPDGRGIPAGYRQWTLSSDMKPDKEKDAKAAEIIAKNTGTGCFGSGSYACLNFCNGCDQKSEGEKTMKKYFDVHMLVYGDCKPGYSVFVEADDSQTAVDKVRDDCLYEEPEDLNNIDYVEEVTEKEYKEAMGIHGDI